MVQKQNTAFGEARFTKAGVLNKHKAQIMTRGDSRFAVSQPKTGSAGVILGQNRITKRHRYTRVYDRWQKETHTHTHSSRQKQTGRELVVDWSLSIVEMTNGLIAGVQEETPIKQLLEDPARPLIIQTDTQGKRVNRNTRGHGSRNTDMF